MVLGRSHPTHLGAHHALHNEPRLVTAECARILRLIRGQDAEVQRIIEQGESAAPGPTPGPITPILVYRELVAAEWYAQPGSGGQIHEQKVWALALQTNEAVAVWAVHWQPMAGSGGTFRTYLQARIGSFYDGTSQGLPLGVQPPTFGLWAAGSATGFVTPGTSAREWINAVGSPANPPSIVTLLAVDVAQQAYCMQGLVTILYSVGPRIDFDGEPCDAPPGIGGG